MAAGNGDARASIHSGDTPWESIRALIWHTALNTDLSQCAGSIRIEDGIVFNTGFSLNRLITAIDLQKLFSKLSTEIGTHRRERMLDFAAGIPPDRLGVVERQQLKMDVRRLAHLASAGGYGAWVHEA